VPNLLTSFWASLGYLGVTLAGATGLAYWLFKLSTEKWLAQRFSEKLEDHKHAQQRELEKLRHQISSTMDRTTKLHQFEFETLPKLWSLAASAFGEVQRFVAPLQTHPDLDRMSENELDHFLSNSTLPEWQKTELRTGKDKAMRYAKVSFWLEANRVNKIYFAFHNYLIGNGIFIPDDLKAKFKTLRDMLHEAMFERTFEEEHPNHRPDRFEKGRALRENGSSLMEAIEGKVQSRLRYTPLNAGEV
jgi:hypothetical protein